MRPARATVLIAVMVSMLGGSARATTVDLTSGTSGSNTGGLQTFNETRGVDVTVQGAADLVLASMTLRGLYIGTASAVLGARVYDSGTHALVSSVDATVP